MGVQALSDAKWDKKLGISTAAGGYEKDDARHSRYEPTAYAVLKRLAESGYIGKENVLLDYGCGKGRVGFFLNHAVGCRTVGVEYNEELVRAAEENRRGYAGREKMEFVCANAENYEVRDEDCFYFFNPFPVRTLEIVLRRILDSHYAAPRKMRLFFYYALDPYLSYLMTQEELRYEGDIDVSDLFPGSDLRERILVFGVGTDG